MLENADEFMPFLEADEDITPGIVLCMYVCEWIG